MVLFKIFVHETFKFVQVKMAVVIAYALIGVNMKRVFSYVV